MASQMSPKPTPGWSCAGETEATRLPAESFVSAPCRSPWPAVAAGRSASESRAESRVDSDLHLGTLAQQMRQVEQGPGTKCHQVSCLFSISVLLQSSGFRCAWQPRPCAAQPPRAPDKKIEKAILLGCGPLLVFRQSFISPIGIAAPTRLFQLPAAAVFCMKIQLIPGPNSAGFCGAIRCAAQVERHVLAESR